MGGAETRLELAALTTGHARPASAAPADPAVAELRREGELWRIRHRGATAHLSAIKGLADLAVLLAQPGTDVHVLELAAAATTDHAGGDLLDPTARAAVTSRVRDAIRRIRLVHPELGAHLDRSVRTGTHCCYQPVEPLTWALAPDKG